ncbi:unnamed protein product, partial [Dicrocoelium dendriticum]
MLCMISKSFGITTNKTFVILFFFVRLYMEYCVQAGLSCLVCGKLILRCVLRIGVKLVYGLMHLFQVADVLAMP